LTTNDVRDWLATQIVKHGTQLALKIASEPVRNEVIDTLTRWESPSIDLKETGEMIEKLAYALEVAQEFFIARDEMNARVHVPADVRPSPITELVNEALETWQAWEFG
jgi:hypothetical protein